MKIINFSKINKIIKNENGYITLISVIIVSAVCVTIAVSMLYNGMVASQTSLTITQAAEARLLSNTCAEEALSQIRSDASYEGTSSISQSNGSCNYEVIKGAGEIRTIQSTGTVSSAKARVEVSVDSLNPTINISNWVEIADF